MIAAVVAAIIVGLAGLGVGTWALVSQPVQGPSGARGAVGPQGASGARGATGLTGPQGKAGPQGAPGTVIDAQRLVANPLVSQPDPAVGTVLVSKLSCAKGHVLLSGGAQVTAPGVGDRNVVLRSSFPISSQTWQVVSMVIGPLGTGNAMTMRPFVMCGTP